MKKIIIATLCALSSALVLAAESNLLRNPSFEEGVPNRASLAESWTMQHPDTHGDTYGSASREDWRSYDGLYIMAIRGLWANAGDYGGCWQEADAEPGRRYRASGWFWADPEWRTELQEMKLEFWSADYEELLTTKSTSIRRIGPDWRRYEVEARAPDNADKVRLVIHAEGVGYYGALQFDHLVMADVEYYAEPEARPLDLIIDIVDEE